MIHTVTWINKPWGISPHQHGQFYVVYGDDEMVVCTGIYANRRKAKKEITHYITKGLNVGSFHGAYHKMRLINRMNKRMNNDDLSSADIEIHAEGLPF